MLKSKIKRLIKEALFRSPLRRNFFPTYDYNFTPPQLCFLCQCLEHTTHVPGAIAEIGCAGGLTTLFLNKYMDAQGIQKSYHAVDTFSGFVVDDVDFEVANRGKSRNLYRSFRVNKKKWFEGTMHQNNISRVDAIEANVHEFDFAKLGAISLALLDVDLYRPMKKSLPSLFDILTPGGIIVVDDCDPDDIRWDGSDQAYKEFMESIDQPPQIMHGKLGIVRKTP